MSVMVAATVLSYTRVDGTCSVPPIVTVRAVMSAVVVAEVGKV